jgi:hypothetical protein
MNLIEITLPPAEAIPFSLEAWQSGNYEPISRNGEKPLRVIHVPESPEDDEQIVSVRCGAGVQFHYETGVAWNYSNQLDLLLLPKAAAEPLRGKYVVVGCHNIADSEQEAKKLSEHFWRNGADIIHFK